MILVVWGTAAAIVAGSLLLGYALELLGVGTCSARPAVGFAVLILIAPGDQAARRRSHRRGADSPRVSRCWGNCAAAGSPRTAPDRRSRGRPGRGGRCVGPVSRQLPGAQRPAGQVPIGHVVAIYWRAAHTQSPYVAAQGAGQSRARRGRDGRPRPVANRGAQAFV